MLIYNYQKEFLGIDEESLKALGFTDLSQLRSESADFADLFVKTPGFIHNFKHVHWIDFVTCAESNEESKVIIHANGKNFRSTLDIKTAYLVDNPTQKAYLVNLMNLRALTHSENEQVAGDVLEKPAPRASTQSSAIFNTPEFSGSFHDDKVIEKEEPQEETEVTHDPYELSITETLNELDSNPNVVEDIYENAPIDLGDDLLEIEKEEDNFRESDKLELEDENIHVVQEEETKSTPVPAQVLNVGSDYLYDPHLASDELGLPVDLIEEFIEDFISQANEFKDNLYASLNEADIDNVKILSHKLKGVAANLRIEDAFEVLTTINTSNDNDEIKINIDTFYIIIDKLSGKTFQKPENLEDAEEASLDNENDDLILSFKDDDEKDIEEEIQIQEPKEHKIEDSEVPQKIEMPELADDDFLTIELDTETLNESDTTTDLNKLEEFNKELEPDKESEAEIKLEELDIVQDNSQILYNKTSAANEIGIDSQNFNELFEDYTAESNNACSKINEAIEKNDPGSWKSSAIKLKGMSDNMRIHDFTSELESIIHTQDSNIAKVAIDTISAKLEQISKVKG